MIPNNFKTSIRIPSQLPEFIRDDINYETFVSFVQAYYEWTELANAANANTTIVSTTNQGATYGSKNLTNYFDIDSTIDGFTDFFVNDFLPFFPENALSDKSLVLKVAKQLYQTKGTPASYDFLFRMLYNSPADILETRDLVLRASDGNWYIPKTLKVKANGDLWLTPGIANLRVFGEISKSFANIEKVSLNVNKFDVYISDIQRLFQSGESVRVVDTFNQDVYVLNDEIVSSDTPGASLVTGKLVGALSTINIDSKRRGLTYNVGDPVVVYGGLSTPTGLGAKAEVSEVTRGAVQRIYVTEGGYGYRPGVTTTASVTNFSNTQIKITPTSGGALAHVQDFVTSAEKQANVALLPINIIQIKENTILGNSNYFFENVATSNANTKLSNAFTFQAFTTYPISSVIVDNGGGGFTQLPSVEAVSQFYDREIGTSQDLSKIGILAPLQLVTGGTGYKANDSILIDGGWGWGASANVKTVNPSGTITSIDWVPYDHPGQVYPLGGLGYRMEDVQGTGFAPLSISVSSSIKVGVPVGNYNLFETVVQLDANSEPTFGGVLSGYDSVNRFVKIYNYQGTLRSNVNLIGTSSGAYANVANSTITGTGAVVQPTGILGMGAEFSLTTDRIGSITKITITDPGEDYVSTPQISFKVHDLCISGIATNNELQQFIPGTKVFQGTNIDLPQYSAFIDSIKLIQSGETVANSIYNLRVYNYFKAPKVYDEEDASNTIFKIATTNLPYPTFILDTELDSTLGYKNGYKQYGDGNARATAKFLNGLIFGNGRYLNKQGQPSSYSLLQSKDVNDYTYRLTVAASISKYREILKKLLHPSGMNVVGIEALNNQKSFKITKESTLGEERPLYYFSDWPVGNKNTYITMQVDSGRTSTNTINIIDGDLGAIVKPSDIITVYSDDGALITSPIEYIDDANNKLILQDRLFLKYPNVAYAYANTELNKIQISDISVANTPQYDIINNGNYSDANNHIKDIIFVGDEITIAGNTYIIKSIDYVKQTIGVEDEIGILITEDANLIITDGPVANNIIMGNRALTGGTKQTPVPITINRVISTANVTIKQT